MSHMTLLKTTILREPLRTNGESQPRIGAPRSYSDRDEHKILRFIRRNPKCKYEEIREGCEVPWSNTTQKRIFRRHGITNWRARKCPFRTELEARKRYQWCKNRRQWT